METDNRLGRLMLCVANNDPLFIWCIDCGGQGYTVTDAFIPKVINCEPCDGEGKVQIWGPKP